MRNVRLHARHNHLCYVLSTQRWVPEPEAVIIPRKISIIPLQVSPQIAEAKHQWHLCFRECCGGIGEIEQNTDMRLWTEKLNRKERVTG